jgi:hypothetical protein
MKTAETVRVQRFLLCTGLKLSPDYDEAAAKAETVKLCIARRVPTGCVFSGLLI